MSYLDRTRQYFWVNNLRVEPVRISDEALPLVLEENPNVFNTREDADRFLTEYLKMMKGVVDNYVYKVKAVI